MRWLCDAAAAMGTENKDRNREEDALLNVEANTLAACAGLACSSESRCMSAGGWCTVKVGFAIPGSAQVCVGWTSALPVRWMVMKRGVRVRRGTKGTLIAKAVHATM